jgi:hypothetical protein
MNKNSKTAKKIVSKSAKKTVVKAAATKKAKTRTSFQPNQKIKVLAKENPRREKTTGWKNFRLYKTGMSIEAYVGKGGLMSKLLTDVKRGSVAVS